MANMKEALPLLLANSRPRPSESFEAINDPSNWKMFWMTYI
jgi:hypothetical protein